MKLLQALYEMGNKPRMRVGPDGKLIPATHGDTIPWDGGSAAPSDTIDWDPSVGTEFVDDKKKKKEPEMQAQEQEPPAPVPGQPPRAPLSADAKAKQAATKERLKGKQGGGLSSKDLKQQASLARRMGSGDPQQQILQVAKGNPKDIPTILQILTKAYKGGGGNQLPAQPGQGRGGKQTRRMSRTEADNYLRKLGIQVESFNNNNVPMQLIMQLAQRMPRHQLLALIRTIENIQREGTRPGQQPTGEWRKNPPLAGIERNDTPGPAPRRGAAGRFIDWLRR